jgi:branched-chain amino acid transport system permease protein
LEYLSHTLNVAIIYVVLTLSLNLILGFGGMVSMAHAAFFCIGGYVSTLVTMKLGLGFISGLAVATLSTGILGGLLAAPFIRVREEYLLLFTLAFQMAVYHLMLSLYEVTGGDSGIFGVPNLEIFGLSASSPQSAIPFMLVFVAIVYYVCLKLTRSPFGRVLKGIREDESTVRSLGKNAIQFKVLVFMVGTGIAAAAGSVFAHYTRFINPTIGNLDESILIIAMVVLGGTANLWGSAVGALLLIVIPEILNFLPGTTNLIVPLRGLIYGILLILFVRFRPEGIVPEYFMRRGQTHTPGVEKSGFGVPDLSLRKLDNVNPGRTSGDGTLLEVKGLCRAFGGIQAVDNFSMGLEKGKITALVGPNGCGKTTAFNMITGFLKPDKGRIHYGTRDITNLPAHKMAGMGIVRSWQDVRIFQGMTVLDNVLLARQNQGGERLRKLFFSPWRMKRERKIHLERALFYLDIAGLRYHAWEIARNLSYAEQKLLAISRLLATEASVLLLDEPSSGVDPNWVKNLMQIIRELSRSGKTICIVEHNLEVVRETSDTVYFMAEGRKVAQGQAEALMADPELREIYFGV